MKNKFSLLAAACLMFATQALAEDPRMKQGAIFESQGNFEMALGEYRAILAEDSKNADAYLAAANVRVKMKDYAGAIANYRLAYKNEPKMSAAYEGAAKVYELLGDRKKAAAERDKDPKNHPVEEAPAEAPVQTAAPVEAANPAEAPKAEMMKVAEPATASVKDAEPVEVSKAPKAEPSKVETPKSVETAPTKIVETAPTKTAENLPTDPFEKGKALFAAGKYSEAAPLWREVLKKTPGHAGAYFYAGLTRYELGEMDKAEFNLKKGLEYKEEGNDANYFLACVYQKGNKTELEKKFLKSYLKKAAPNGKYRRKAEDRLAALDADAKAKEAEKVSSEITVSSESKVAVKEEPARTAKVTSTGSANASGAIAETAPEEISIAGAIAQYRAGNLEGALQIYKTLLESELNQDARSFTLLQMGNVYRELRDFNSAVSRYREVVQQFPDSEWAIEAERANEDAIWLQKHAGDLPRRK